MNLTNEQFKAIEDALALLPQDDAFNILPTEMREIIHKADLVLMELRKKKKRDNKRTAEYIAQKRKENKNYAR